MIYFHKILPYALYPITLLFCLLFWALLSKRRTPVLLSLLLLLITSSPLVSNRIVAFIEMQEQRKIIEDITPSDSIVVLSGKMIIPIITKHGITYEWDDPDRFFAGLSLLKAGKAKNIIFTGGELSWQIDAKTEGQILEMLAVSYGVSGSQVIVTKYVQNTYDEALAVKELLVKNNTNRIILVTSAFHMPRASYLFNQQGIEVQTYPVDFKSTAKNLSIVDFLPSAEAFYMFQFALREIIGRTYYMIK